MFRYYVRLRKHLQRLDFVRIRHFEKVRIEIMIY